jgi:hypothetical protein
LIQIVLFQREYLSAVDAALSKNFVDCFGPDRALDSFRYSKAINFAMTSFLLLAEFAWFRKLISFNLEVSIWDCLERHLKLQMVLNIHPGEDPDLSIRLWNLVLKPDSFLMPTVYHKRRIDWDKFSVQVNKFGKEANT